MTSKTISTTVSGYKFAASNSSLTITATGKVTGNGDFGLSAVYAGPTRANETVVNLGIVTSANQLWGITLKDGGKIINGSATDTTASISGSDIGIKITGKAGTVTNLGSIYGYTNAIYLHEGGNVTNGSATNATASIVSHEYSAIRVDYGVSNVTNFGTIKGEIQLDGGGSVTNQASGRIIDPNAVNIASGTVTNLGTISGQVKLGAGQVINGSKTNHAASIGGASSNYGVYIGETGTLTNFGTISAKTTTGGIGSAVTLGYHAQMFVEAGSAVIGASFGANATLVFGSAGGAGTISGLGTGAITGSTTEHFKDMATYQIQAGGDWTLSGTKNNLKAGDSLTVFGSLTLGGSLLGAGSLSIGKTGTIKATTGSVAIGTAIVNAGVLAVSGGTLTLDRAVTGAGVAKISGGTLFAEGAFSENVTFGAKGQLELAHSLTYKGSVTGFSHTGTTSLDLRDIKFGAGTKATFAGTAAGGTLTVTDGTHTAKIKLVGNYTGVTFKASSDGHLGTTITDAAKTAASVPSFISAMAATGSPSSGLSPSLLDSPHAATTLLAHPRR